MSRRREQPDEPRSDGPAHPAFAAALLMIGVVVFLIIVALAGAR